MLRFIASALALTLLGASCATAPLETSAPPAWVTQSEQMEAPDTLTAIGRAPPQESGGERAQRRVALIVACKGLAERLRVHIRADEIYRTEERRGTVQRTQDKKLTLSASEFLQLERAQITQEWRDPSSGELYVLLVLPISPER